MKFEQVSQKLQDLNWLAMINRFKKTRSKEVQKRNYTSTTFRLKNEQIVFKYCFNVISSVLKI